MRIQLSTINQIINHKNITLMTKTITFNELRRIKDSLPDGSMHRIADELNVTNRPYVTISEAVIIHLGKIAAFT